MSNTLRKQLEISAKRHPNNFRAMEALATFYREDKHNLQSIDAQLQKAEEIYTRILHENPENIDTLMEYATLCIDKKDYNEAEKLLQRCIKINPKYSRPHCELASMKLLQCSNSSMMAAKTKHVLIDEVIAHLETATLCDDKNAQSWFKLGKLFKDLGDFPRAKQSFENCVKNDNMHVESYLELGWLYKSEENASLAVVMYHYVLEISKDNAEANEELGTLHYEIYKNVKNAKEYIRAA